MNPAKNAIQITPQALIDAEVAVANALSAVINDFDRVIINSFSNQATIAQQLITRLSPSFEKLLSAYTEKIISDFKYQFDIILANAYSITKNSAAKLLADLQKNITTFIYENIDPHLLHYQIFFSKKSPRSYTQQKKLTEKSQRYSILLTHI